MKLHQIALFVVLSLYLITINIKEITINDKVLINNTNNSNVLLFIANCTYLITVKKLFLDDK